MKRQTLFFSLALVLTLFGSCLSFDSFFPMAQKPIEDSASMLVVEAGTRSEGSSAALLNTNASGWAPWVEDEDGNLVAFRAFDSEARLDSLFWAENVSAGRYTHKGFLHIHVDYGKLPEGVIMDYEPFAYKEWHTIQRFPIEEESVIDLEEADMQTFGRYYIDSEWVEGPSGTTDLRWMVDPASVKIEGDAKDKKALRIIKNWRSSVWLAWNERNKEEAADN